MRLLVALLTVASGAVFAPPSAARVACTSGSVETFDVRAEPREHTYKIGDVALVDVWVTDRATGAPQADVDSGAMLEPEHKKKVVMDHGRTDVDGHLLLRLHLRPDRVKPGKAKVYVAAWEWVITPASCTSRYGYREYPNLFRIRRA